MGSILRMPSLEQIGYYLQKNEEIARFLLVFLCEQTSNERPLPQIEIISGNCLENFSKCAINSRHHSWNCHRVFSIRTLED